MPRNRSRPSVPERRDRLLDAAAKVFGRRGLSGATVAEIATAARIAKGSFYTLFGSKEELFAALRKRHVDGLLGRAREIANRLGSEDLWGLADEFLVALIDAEFEFRDLTQVYAREGITAESSELFAAAERTMQELIANGIRVGVAAGLFNVTDPWITAGLLMRGIHGVIVQAITRDPSITRERIVTAGRELVIRTLKGP